MLLHCTFLQLPIYLHSFAVCNERYMKVWLQYSQLCLALFFTPGTCCRHAEMMAVYNQHLLDSGTPVLRFQQRRWQHTMADTPRSNASSTYDLEDSFLAQGMSFARQQGWSFPVKHHGLSCLCKALCFAWQLCCNNNVHAVCWQYHAKVMINACIMLSTLLQKRMSLMTNLRKKSVNMMKHAPFATRQIIWTCCCVMVVQKHFTCLACIWQAFLLGNGSVLYVMTKHDRL